VMYIVLVVAVFGIWLFHICCSTTDLNLYSPDIYISFDENVNGGNLYGVMQNGTVFEEQYFNLNITRLTELDPSMKVVHVEYFPQNRSQYNITMNNYKIDNNTNQIQGVSFSTVHSNGAVSVLDEQLIQKATMWQWKNFSFPVKASSIKKGW